MIPILKFLAKNTPDSKSEPKNTQWTKPSGGGERPPALWGAPVPLPKIIAPSKKNCPSSPPPSPPKNHGNIVIEASGWGAGLDHFLSLLPSPKMLSPTQKGVFQFPCDQTQFDPDPDEIPGRQDPDTTDGGSFARSPFQRTHTQTHRRPSC